MSSQSAYAGTGATGAIGGIGTGGVAWSNPSNITSSDNSYATVNLSNTDNTAQVLIATNFSFSLPLHSTINGVVATFERKASAADTIRDSHIYLVHNNGLIGNNKISAPAYWSTTEGSVSFGGPADTWGASLTSPIVQDSSFGVLTDAIWQNVYSGTETAYVDSVLITVYYTVNYWSKYGSNNIKNIYYGSTQVARVYHGSTRVA
jgi:hypothetical protein